jgi:pimeloyl-ACP methyl ester carboxylesterase
MQPLNPLAPPAVSRLGAVQAPALVISGSLDYDETLRACALMAKAIPGAKAVTIPDAAHVPNLDHPALFNQIVLDFLQGLG